MNGIVVPAHATGRAEGRKFVINLMVSQNAKVSVRSCEIVNSEFRNRTTFAKRTSLQEVFVPEFAEVLSDCLSGLSNKSEVISLPSVLVELPGLSLSGAQLMCTKLDNGDLSVIVRFTFLLGGISATFRQEIGLNDSVREQTNHLSAAVLSDLALPLMNLCAVIETQSNMDLSKHLTERSEELMFQIELVKRFVEQDSDMCRRQFQLN